MNRGKAMHQESMQVELALEGRGEAPRAERSGEAGRAAQGKERSGSCDLMERVVARENAIAALKRVRRNKGSPGIDGMGVEDLEPYLREHWSASREQLLAGSYCPSAVKRQLIPKSGGGMRGLGIPTVLDRFVQQLILQVLAALRQTYAKLRLRVNEEKSAVARVGDRKFLGYSFWVAAGGKVKCRVAPKAREGMKQRVRQITNRNGGRSMEQVTAKLGVYLRGWKAYFKLAETPGKFAALDSWIHRRLRMLQLKQWKRGRTTFRELAALGLPEWLVRKGAGHGGRWWGAAGLGAMHTALPGAYFDRLGVPRLAVPTSTL